MRKCLSFQVGLVVLTFLICWLPFFVLALVIPLVGRVPGAVQTTLHLQLGGIGGYNTSFVGDEDESQH